MGALHTPSVVIVNKSTVLPDEQIRAAMPSFRQAAKDFERAWNVDATIRLAPPGATLALLRAAWQIVILDDSDQAGALGYHDWQPNGLPLAKVFARTDQKYGLSWSVTLTHELFEMLADPYISTALQVDNTRFYALEVGDPVEADQYAYESIPGSGVKISDFVYPSWFLPGEPGPYDHEQVVDAPLKLASGGYASIFTSGEGWGQVQMRDGRELAMTPDPHDPRFRDRSSPRAERVGA